ncbi:hypothetical protein Poly41_40650 [Novipirellula artificiosorum]|uniref:Uncharacterized protein n=1 Tax=Novipirellula artificiosorum TaxID=2528016 RepID=A0A5C6DDU7_9BACT|nr:hypothetical protein Poly41_40650 [Novipirellula artificiosorum]
MVQPISCSRLLTTLAVLGILTTKQEVPMALSKINRSILLERIAPRWTHRRLGTS